MPVFEVAVVEHPTPEDEAKGVLERLVLGPKCVVAKDTKSAALFIILEAKGALEVDPSRAEVLVRPFV